MVPCHQATPTGDDVHRHERQGVVNRIEPSATTGPPVRVDAEALHTCVERIFVAVGVPDGDAAIAADALVAGELRGVTTHGVANLAPRYVSWIEESLANPRPEPRLVRGASALMNIDGDGGLGVVVAPRVMGDVVNRARETGIAMATVHNSRHLGMAAYHAMLALEHDMIGICTTAVAASMVPTFGSEPRLGTNPIAVAVPTGDEPAFVFDAAMTTVAGNKLRLKARAGEVAPPGWMVDLDGEPVREATVPVEPFRLSPLGGTPESSSYKGYGLAAIVDILGAVLSQASFGQRFQTWEAAHMLAAIHVDAVQPIDEFRTGMDEYVRMLTSTPPAPGHDEVLVAGQREHRANEAHLRDGVPLPSAAVTWIEQSGQRYGLQLPDLSPTPAPR